MSFTHKCSRIIALHSNHSRKICKGKIITLFGRRQLEYTLFLDFKNGKEDGKKRKSLWKNDCDLLSLRIDIKEQRSIDEGKERLRFNKVSKGQQKFAWSRLQQLSLVNYSLAFYVHPGQHGHVISALLYGLKMKTHLCFWKYKRNCLNRVKSKFYISYWMSFRYYECRE